jgi:hypothetical protein
MIEKAKNWFKVLQNQKYVTTIDAHNFHRHFLSTHHVPDTLPDTGDTQ